MMGGLFKQAGVGLAQRLATARLREGLPDWQVALYQPPGFSPHRAVRRQVMLFSAALGILLLVILAGTVVLALIGTTLACLNTAVRVSYVMGKDRELPSVLGLLHGRYATPHWGIWILVAVSAALGGYGALNVDNLTKITLASNTGTFLVYGMTNLVAVVAFLGRPGASRVKHLIVPVLGALANLIMLIFVVKLSISAGGSTQTDTLVALGMVGVWLAAGIVWLLANSLASRQPIIAGSG